MAFATARAGRLLLPRGQSLPEEAWRSRHLAIVALLWAHAAAVPVYALERGYSVSHAVGEGAILAVAAVAASMATLPRRARTAAVSIGLLSSSAILVHLSGGLIEMHFHFFVMVTVVALYQDWIPFLASIGYVFVHHGVLGALHPESVFNHQAALNNPWRWALIHALFIAGISAVCLVTWRLNESMLDQRRLAEARLDDERGIVETLNDMGEFVAAELDLERAVQRVTDAATQLSDAAFGAFFYNVTEDDGGSYMLYALSGAQREVFERFPMPRKTAVFGPTFAGEAVVRLDDVTEDPRYGKNAPHHGMPEGHLPVRSYLAVPVRSRGGEVLGGVFLGHPEAARFTEAHEQLVVGVAAHAAVAIENARLYESERRSKEASEAAQRRLAALATASEALSATLELDDLLRKLAATVVPAVRDSCTVFLIEEDGRIRRVASQSDPALATVFDGIKLMLPSLSSDAHPVARVIRSGRPELFTEIGDQAIDALADAESRQAVHQLTPVSAIVAPLNRRGEVIGVLAILTTGLSGRTLTRDDLALAEELAGRAAVAVENARLYTGQRTVAETLQHSLLPERLPDVTGITMAARYLSGGPGVDVGGDWYDVLALPDGSLLLVMGDVMGKGIPAASLMGQLRNAIRAYAFDGHSPADICTRLDRLLSQTTPSNGLTTVVVARLDPAASTLDTVRAGHLPPLIVAPDGTGSFCTEGDAPPLGVVAPAHFEQARTVLAPGSTILLYTDGLVESRTIPLDEGFDRLRAAAGGTFDDLDELCDHILDRAFSDRIADDDTALLAVRLNHAAATVADFPVDLREGAADEQPPVARLLDLTVASAEPDGTPEPGKASRPPD